MKTERLQEIISEEVLNMLEVSMTRKFRKAVEELQKVQLAQQQLRKKFVAEKDPKKKEKLKQDIIKMHKVVQKAESDFNSAIKAEPVDLDEAFKKGDKVKYLGNPGVITHVEDKMGKTFYSVKYKGPGGTRKAKGVLSTDGSITEGKLNEDVFTSFKADIPGSKIAMAYNTENRKSVQARKTDRVWDDGVPVLKYIARAPKKPSPLPKGKFKIIEDNKYGWWYYQVGRNWYGIQQKDYGTPPFEY